MVDIDSFATDNPQAYQNLIQLGLTDAEIRAVLTENEQKRQLINVPNAPKLSQEDFATLDAIFETDTQATTTTQGNTITIYIKYFLQIMLFHQCQQVKHPKKYALVLQQMVEIVVISLKIYLYK